MKVKALALLGLLALLAWTKPASAETYHACTGYISSLPYENAEVRSSGCSAA